MDEDEDESVVGYSIEDLAVSMNLGSNFFTKGDYVLAGSCFRDARDISIQIYGEFSCECALARYDYGLSLLCQVPLLQNDPMNFLPKEVDYYQSQKKPYPSHCFSRYIEGTMGDPQRKILGDAKRELDLAWSIMEGKPEDYNLGKAYILSALGEAAFRRGEPNPQHYYSEALSIFERVYGEPNTRIADISKAIEYGAKACFFYETIGRRLLSSIPSSSTPAAPSPTAKKRRETSLVTQNDPFIERNRKLASGLLSVAGKLKDKLDHLNTAIPAGDGYAREGAQINTNLELGEIS